MNDWSPQSWRAMPATQLPTYPEPQALLEVEKRLSEYPPLVFTGETQLLKARLAEVAQGKAFLLQGGDCAESFEEFSVKSIRDNFRVLLQMANILSASTKKPIVKVGRIAGQFAKPRSSLLETRNGVTLPAYRGDLINSFEFTPQARIPDPTRMDKAYFQSAATLSLLRAFSQESHPEVHGPEAQPIEFFTSHEALLLPYEEALTRPSASDEAGDESHLSSQKHWYAGSAHMLWVGERTRQLGGAHVEFARGIENPLGLKCGPEMTADELLRLIDVLNPKNEPGRLTLVTRLGKDKVEAKLPLLIRAVQGAGRTVAWCCDPMHGNTMMTANGYKTRVFEHVLFEAKKFFEVHRQEGTYGGGVHFEQTAKDVTECIGGSPAIREEQLTEGLYETLCDPRLNASQAVELARQLSPSILLRFLNEKI
jgi:3-deoxy-7-phosphoheptulonate synthase